MYQNSEIVVYDGIIAEYSLIAMFVDKEKNLPIVKATLGEEIKYRSRPDKSNS